MRSIELSTSPTKERLRKSVHAASGQTRAHVGKHPQVKRTREAELAAILEHAEPSQSFTPMDENVCGVLYLWNRDVACELVSEIGTFGLTLSRVADLQATLGAAEVVFALARYYRLDGSSGYTLEQVLPNAVWLITRDEVRPIRQMHHREQPRWTAEGWVQPSQLYTPPGTDLRFSFIEPETVRAYLRIQPLDAVS